MVIETFAKELQWWKSRGILAGDQMEELKMWMKSGDNVAFRNLLDSEKNKETAARFTGWQNWGRHHVEICRQGLDSPIGDLNWAKLLDRQFLEDAKALIGTRLRYHSIHLPLYTKKAVAEYDAAVTSNHKKWPVREHPYPVSQTATRLFLSSSTITTSFAQWSQGLGITIGCTAKQNHNLLPYQNQYIGEAYGPGPSPHDPWIPGPIEAYVSLWRDIRRISPTRGWEMELVCRPDILRDWDTRTKLNNVNTLQMQDASSQMTGAPPETHVIPNELEEHPNFEGDQEMINTYEEQLCQEAVASMTLIRTRQLATSPGLDWSSLARPRPEQLGIFSREDSQELLEFAKKRAYQA